MTRTTKLLHEMPRVPPLAAANHELSKGWPARKPPSPARSAVHAALAAQANKTTAAIIKLRARNYALRPRELDALGEDLSSLPPRHLVAAFAFMMRNPTQYRWFGNGGCIPAINLRGALLYARLRRAQERKLAGRTA